MPVSPSRVNVEPGVARATPTRAAERYAVVCGAGYVSGKEIMTFELARGLQARGCAVKVITSTWNDGDFCQRLEVANLSYESLPLGFISATLRREPLLMTGEQVMRWPALARDYRRALRQQAPHRVVHTNWHHLILLLPFLSASRDVFWVHEVLPNKPQYRLVFAALVPRLFCFVAVSQAAALALVRLGVPSSKIRTIWNGIEDPACGVRRRAVDGDPLSIGVVGQVNVHKGHEDLVKAAALLRDAGVMFRLDVYGVGPQVFGERLREMCVALGIADRVHWHGNVRDRRAIFPNIDICAVPSRCEEAFGLVAVEAGFFRVPVIASKRGGLTEVVQDGVSGFVVEPGDPAALAARLRDLLQDAGLRRRMGAAGHLRANAYFTRERVLDEFEVCLRSDAVPSSQGRAETGE